MCAILEGGNRSHGSHVEARPIVRDGQRVIRESPPSEVCTLYKHFARRAERSHPWSVSLGLF